MSANAPAISSTKDVVLPPKEELLKAMQNAEKSPELARYLQTRAHNIVEKSRYYNKSPEAMKAAKDVEKAIDDFVQLVIYKFSSRAETEAQAGAQVWDGEIPETSSFKNMQKGIAEKAVSNLTEKNYTGIRFDFAISQDGHFVRGYAAQGTDTPLEEGTIDSLDQLFNAWLADKHQIATENGYLFKTDADGNKIQKLTVEEVEQLLADSAKEFRDYIRTSKVETDLVSYQREYPGERRLEEIRRVAAEKAVEKLIEAEELEAAEVEITEAEVEPTGMGRQT